MSRQGDDLENVTPDNFHITRKNKRTKTLDTPFIRKWPIVDTVNPREMAKYDTVTDVEEYSL